MAAALRPGRYYHIYNRGNAGADLFREKRNYRFFLKKYAHYIEPVAQTFAYCLLRNHFHLLVHVRPGVEDASHQFARLFNSYTKAVNRDWGRTGNLFQRPFKRREVASEAYFATLARYIHHNPQAHGFVEDFRTWPHSSYPALRSTRATRLPRALVMDWFGGRASFRAAHGAAAPTPPAVDEDFETQVEGSHHQTCQVF